LGAGEAAIALPAGKGEGVGRRKRKEYGDDEGGREEHG